MCTEKTKWKNCSNEKEIESLDSEKKRKFWKIESHDTRKAASFGKLKAKNRALLTEKNRSKDTSSATLLASCKK